MEGRYVDPSRARGEEKRGRGRLRRWSAAAAPRRPSSPRRRRRPTDARSRTRRAARRCCRCRAPSTWVASKEKCCRRPPDPRPPRAQLRAARARRPVDARTWCWCTASSSVRARRPGPNRGHQQGPARRHRERPRAGAAVHRHAHRRQGRRRAHADPPAGQRSGLALVFRRSSACPRAGDEIANQVQIGDKPLTADAGARRAMEREQATAWLRLALTPGDRQRHRAPPAGRLRSAAGVFIPSAAAGTLQTRAAPWPSTPRNGRAGARPPPTGWPPPSGRGRAARLARWATRYPPPAGCRRPHDAVAWSAVRLLVQAKSANPCWAFEQLLK